MKYREDIPDRYGRPPCGAKRGNLLLRRTFFLLIDNIYISEWDRRVALRASRDDIMKEGGQSAVLVRV